jgi:CRISPR/Cas system-associated exonuclease Cas4 (RecB family)
MMEGYALSVVTPLIVLGVAGMVGALWRSNGQSHEAITRAVVDTKKEIVDRLDFMNGRLRKVETQTEIGMTRLGDHMIRCKEQMGEVRQENSDLWQVVHQEGRKG